MELKEEHHSRKEIVTARRDCPEMVGKSTELKEALRLISIVAPTSSTVLISGETGTGKELVAGSIHDNSSRKGKAMVKVNCAALPANLVESELFGHERGSFTGATERRIGKFELAHGSTLFLDEIGELPLELQSKLLRALQEKEIERIGRRTVIKVDVRIVAATNRDLEKEVKEGRFRADLYYRLNIFPICMPPLRNRREDISFLLDHFVARLSIKVGKKISAISSSVLDEAMSYDWPGNIREMEHVIERSILLSSDGILRKIHLPHPRPGIAGAQAENGVVIKTMEEAERDHILKILRLCRGRITGYRGAAQFLALPPSTLHSKMKRLGIQKEYLQKL